jgi:prophage regulatory protein
MYDIPVTGFLRLPQVLTVFPVGKTCWWEGVKSGRYPKPVKLSPRCTAWRVEDILELIKHPPAQLQGNVALDANKLGTPSPCGAGPIDCKEALTRS